MRVAIGALLMCALALAIYHMESVISFAQVVVAGAP